MKRLVIFRLVCLLLCGTGGGAPAAEPAHSVSLGHGSSLVIVGGALRPDNRPVFQRLIHAAGGPEQARFVIFPSAAKTDRSARELREVLAGHGIAAEQITIVDLTPENSARQAANPEVIQQIEGATGAFFIGGDQVRIVRALLNPDGSATPALVALKELWRRGGVVAGSSAGAAVQSARMLSVAGLPDDLLDEGMDALDFGISSDVRRRGLLVTKGLGFFEAGIVDQHFNQYRGRLGRLSRALIEQKVRFGFGIDEDTAMCVAADGQVEVVGHGSLTVVDAAQARLDDDALGCHLSQLTLTYLQNGDRFDPVRGVAIVRPEKKPTAHGTQDYHGNFLIADMQAPAALPWGICFGLAENTSRRQQGAALRYSRGFGHGYGFMFTKTDQTKTYAGYVDHFYSYAAVDLSFEVTPMLADLRAPQASLPIDLPAEAAARKPLEALWFRGILLAGADHRLRPTDALTRGELATALAQAIHLTPPGAPPAIGDVVQSAEEYEEIVQVLAAGLMTLPDGGDAFHPRSAVTRREAAASLVNLSKRYAADPTAAQTIDSQDAGDCSRQEFALALCRVIGFSWYQAQPK